MGLASQRAIDKIIIIICSISRTGSQGALKDLEFGKTDSGRKIRKVLAKGAVKWALAANFIPMNSNHLDTRR